MTRKLSFWYYLFWNFQYFLLPKVRFLKLLKLSRLKIKHWVHDEGDALNILNGGQEAGFYCDKTTAMIMIWHRLQETEYSYLELQLELQS